MRTLEELRGSLASLRRAAKRSSAGTFISSAIFFSSARLAAYCATSFSRFLFRLIWLVFAMAASVIREGKLEAFEKRLGLLVGLRRGVENDVHAPNRLRLVVVDFLEHDVLLETQGIVAAPVEALGIDATEVG